jgi:hypothetical protein
MSKALKNCCQIKSELKSFNHLIDDFNPKLERMRGKLKPINSELKATNSSVKFLESQIKHLAENLAKTLGNNIVGNSEAAGKSLFAASNNLFGLLPKLLERFFSGARASGGPVNSGNSYLVGERGPELFVPTSSGQILPSRSNRPINLVMNINTPDADSFRKSTSQIMAEAVRALNRGGRNL